MKQALCARILHCLPWKVLCRAVMQGQACKPQCVLDGIVLGSSYAQYRQLVRAQVALFALRVLELQ